MGPAKREEFFARLKSKNPDPKTELNYENTFQLLISVILSAQATDVSVNDATARLYEDAPTPEAIYGLGVEGLKNYIRTIGLFNNKAKNVIATCKILIDEHESLVPDNRKDLEALPGVGRKTANVVLNTAFRQPTMAVDTHIFRVSNRTGLAAGKNVEEVERQLLKRVPKDYLLDAHHWLILHGRYTCLARTPKCAQCSVIDLCSWSEKTTLAEASAKKTTGKNKKTARKTSTKVK